MMDQDGQNQNQLKGDSLSLVHFVFTTKILI